MEDLLIKRGEMLRYLLDKNNMQVKELATKLNVSSQAVTNWLYGKNEISSDKILTVCSIFKITADDFLNARFHDKTLSNIDNGANKRLITELSNEELNKLADDYAAGMDKKKLEKKYNVETGKNTILSIFPKVLSEKNCPYCGKAMFVKLGYRTRKNGGTKKSIYCESCNHIDSLDCKCEGCQNKKEEEFNKSILENINQEFVDLESVKLTLEEILTLNKIIESSYKNENNFCYKGNISTNLKNLFDKKLLKLPSNYAIYQVNFSKWVLELNGISQELVLNFDIDKFNELLSLSKARIDSLVIEKYFVAIRESALDFIAVLARQIRIYYIKVSDNDYDILTEYLQKYSYSQVCCKILGLFTKFKRETQSFDKAHCKEFVNSIFLRLKLFFDNVENKKMEHFSMENPHISRKLSEFMSLTEIPMEYLFTTYKNLYEKYHV